MKIVILDAVPLDIGDDVSWKSLMNLGDVKIFPHTDPEEFVERVSGADIVLVNKTPVRAENIADLKNCKMVGALATGTNNLDFRDLAASGITVCNVPAYAADDVAQHALALLLETARATALHTQGVLAGKWRDKWCYWEKTPLSLSGLAIGLIGFGSIGQAFGRMVSALDMRVLAWSRSRKHHVPYPAQYASLEEIWPQARVISLHCPLTDETAKIINRRTIDLLPDGAIIINTARGGLVDEAAVADALKSGKLAGFGTDVLSVEPPASDNPLLHAPNVLITPHMAWATTRARQKIIDIMADNIAAFLRGQPINIVGS